MTRTYKNAVVKELVELADKGEVEQYEARLEKLKVEQPELYEKFALAAGFGGATGADDMIWAIFNVPIAPKEVREEYLAAVAEIE
jgi:hypothetical protein